MPRQNTRAKIPWYFLTLLAFLAAPVLALLKPGWQVLHKKAFAWSMLIIMALGYAWSMLATSNRWWTFSPNTLLGIDVLPHLPVEEFLFYPFGGALCLLLYVLLRQRMQAWAPGEWPLLIFILAFTASALLLILLAWRQGARPWYLISQLLVYNGLSLGLWFKVRRQVCLFPTLLTMGILTVIGFFWNWLAFSQGYWEYHAILGWKWPPRVPVDDWNFYLFAPVTAIFLYTVWAEKR